MGAMMFMLENPEGMKFTVHTPPSPATDFLESPDPYMAAALPGPWAGSYLTGELLTLDASRPAIPETVNTPLGPADLAYTSEFSNGITKTITATYHYRPG